MYIRWWPKQIDTKYQTAEMPRLHRSDIMNTVQRVVQMHTHLTTHREGMTMNTIRNNVLIALAALSLGGAALAADTAPAPQAHQGQHQQLTPEQRQARMAEWQAKRAEAMAQRERQLHDDLKLSSSQEAAWSSFVASMKPAAHEEHPDHAAFATLPAPERMRKMIELSKQHTARMESRLGALNTFYSTLSPEQKKVFDEDSRHFMGEHHGRGEHHRAGMARG
jgi:Spy/CpxP family protein refolding chaperone